MGKGAWASTAPPQRLLGRLIAGNKRFADGDLPPLDGIAQARARLEERAAPYATILSCSDSRVIPNLIFAEGIGQLFVGRVAGNYPDDLMIASIEYAVEYQGTRLIVVLGHQNCGAVRAVYSAIENEAPLPAHLPAFRRLIAPGIASVVKEHGSLEAAVEANVRAAVKAIETAPPLLSAAAASGGVLVAGALYHLGSGKVSLLK